MVVFSRFWSTFGQLLITRVLIYTQYWCRMVVKWPFLTIVIKWSRKSWKMTFWGTYVTMVDENGHQTVKQPSDMHVSESSKNTCQRTSKTLFSGPQTRSFYLKVWIMDMTRCKLPLENHQKWSFLVVFGQLLVNFWSRGYSFIHNIDVGWS